MDQPFYARENFHECAVVRDGDHLALDARIDGEALFHGQPGIRELLLVAQRDALGILVVLENRNLDLVAHLEHLAGVVQAAPGHVRDVQQAVHAAQIDEGAVFGDVLDGSFHQLAFFQASQGFFLHVRIDGLKVELAAQNDVAAAAVHLDDLHVEGLAEVGVQVADRFDVHLAAGQEGADADIHGQAALDLLQHDAMDGHVGTEGLLDLVPDLHLLGAFAGNAHVAVDILEVLQEHFHDIAHRDANGPVRVVELVDIDGARAFVADVDDDILAADLHDMALDDLFFTKGAGFTLESGQEFLGVRVAVLVHR